MEKSRHRKSRSASGIIEGGILQKQLATQKLKSRSYCDETAREDLIMLGFGRSSSKRVTGTPIKKLVAEEMAKEGESKRRPPSIVAKLMGLEGMPSPQRVGRLPRRSSDSCLHRNEQIDPRRRGQLFDEQPRRSSVEHQEFKDVFVDLEASHVTNRRHSSRWSDTTRFATPDMALIQQKFMEAKRLSTDERFQNSKEFDDTLEALESNKELLLEYLQEPDPLLVKRVQDLQVDMTSSMPSQIAVLKPSNSLKYEGSVKSSKSQRGGSYKQATNLPKDRADGLLLQSQHRPGGNNSYKSSPVLSEVKEENILPTRIVVLKPNLGIRHSDNSYHPNGRRHKRHPHASPGGAGPDEEKISSMSMGISRSRSKEAIEYAKEITRQMRDSFGPFDGGDGDFRSSGVKGYAGDESSCDVYESDSTADSDITFSSSRKSFGRGKLKKRSSPGSSESLVGMEAKKRLSERWKMAQCYPDIEVAGKSSTLGEMLSLTDGGTKKPYRCDTMANFEEGTNEFGRSKGTTEWDFPLGISSRDGWKDVCINDSLGYRSTSLPLGSKKHRTRGRQEVFANKQHSSPNEPINHSQSVNHRRSRSLDGVLNLRDEFLSKESRSSKKKLHSCRLGSDSPKGKLSQRIDTNQEEKLSENLPNALDDVETKNVTLSSEYSVEMLLKLPSECDNGSLLNQDISNLQEKFQEPSPPSPPATSVLLEYPAPEPESSVSSKDSDHPSPLSVLEVPFGEDASSGSECFERVSAGLNGLRMQLQLLKMESAAYADEAVSDEEVERYSAVAFDDISSSWSQSWQTSFILDVLADSGLKTTDPEAFVASCRSLECPLGPENFDNLEKKYTDETTGPRYERKLLFDRINWGLLEILRTYVDPCPWVQPTEGINWKWQYYGMMNMLHQILKSHESRENTDMLDTIVEEMHWLEFKGDIDQIGKEIEKSLIEDLIVEAVTM